MFWVSSIKVTNKGSDRVKVEVLIFKFWGIIVRRGLCVPVVGKGSPGLIVPSDTRDSDINSFIGEIDEL